MRHKSRLFFITTMAAILFAACSTPPTTPSPATTPDTSPSPPSAIAPSLPNTTPPDAIATPPATDATDLDGTAWTLASLNGSDLIEGTAITLSFTNGEAGGDSGCNSYGGQYTTTSGGTIEFGEIVSTLRACADQRVNEQETAYLDALRNAAAYQIAGDQLQIMNTAGEMTLMFSRQAE